MSNKTLQSVIESAWDQRETINAATRGEVRDAVETALDLLDKGEARVAEKVAAHGSSTNGSRRRSCCPSGSTTWA